MTAALSDLVGAFSNAILTIIAGIALYMAWRQVRVSHEISALEAYENYHLASLQYPQFASGDLDFENAEFRERDCYACFVSYVLMTGERILALFPKEESWAEAIRDDIRIHRRFIASPHFEEYRRNQTRIMTRLIRQVLDEPEVSRDKNAAPIAEAPPTLDFVVAPDASAVGAPFHTTPDRE